MKEQKNYIINGNMDFFMEGNKAAVANNVYGGTLVRHNKVGSAVFGLLQETTIVPTPTNIGDPKFRDLVIRSATSLHFDCSTASASPAAGDYVVDWQFIEGHELQEIQGRYVTVSTLVYATKVGTMCVVFQNSGQDRSYIQEVEIEAANIWHYKYFKIRLADTGGTWDYTTGIGLRVGIVKQAGATFQGSAGSWITGNKLATSNQTNYAALTSDSIYVGQMQIVEGEKPIRFQRAGENIEGELAKISRWYEKTYDDTVVPGTVTLVGAWRNFPGVTTYRHGILFKQIKARIPTITCYSSNNGASGNIYQNGQANAAATTPAVGQGGFTIDATVTTSNDYVFVHYTADARFYT